MKLQKVVALLFVFVSVFITGCETSSESPENLLSDNIIYDKSKNELYTFVNKSLDGTTLILPQNSSQVGQSICSPAYAEICGSRKYDWAVLFRRILRGK